MEPEMTDPTVRIGTATREEIGWIAELLKERAPAFWMRRVPQADLRSFLKYAVESHRCALLLARPAGEPAPVGYVFAVLDARGFWLGFALKNPVIAQKIFFHRLRRNLERSQETARRESAGGDEDALPSFAWSPSHPTAARIIGLHVSKEHRRKGIATRLSAQFESSVPGLYFVGPMAATSFGPVMRFAAGAGFTSRTIAAHLARSTGSKPSLVLQKANGIPGSR